MQHTRTGIMDALNRDYRRLREQGGPQDRPAASLQPVKGLTPEQMDKVATWLLQSKLGQLLPARVPGRYIFIPAGQVEADDMERLVQAMMTAAETRFGQDVFLPNWVLKTAAAASET